MQEPSILDYIKSLFDPEVTIDICNYLHRESGEFLQSAKQEKSNLNRKKGNGKILLGTGLALLAQSFLEPSRLKIGIALISYIGAIYFLWRGIGQQQYSNRKKRVIGENNNQFSIKYQYLILSFLFQFASLLLFKGNVFNYQNITTWILGMIFLSAAVWQPKTYLTKQSSKRDVFFMTMVVIVCLIIFFFRIFQINEIPSEMFSDHAEKLLDVMDVLRGDTHVFFIRNTGREAIQFYVTAMIIKLMNLEINFLSLKIGTIIFGLITLPFVFLIGKDQSNKWGGLISLLFTGIGYWPNVISRVGLRYSLYPLFTAPILFFLLRGLRERDRNYLLISGLLLGSGLHGYSSFRILPFLVVIIFILYLTNRESTNYRIQTVMNLIILGLSAFSAFIPLFRFWIDFPGNFGYRALTRITQIEQPFSEPVFTLFFKNLWKSIIMPFYKNGQIWVHSIPDRPALDFITAGFFFIGFVYLFRKTWYQKNWEAGSLLISVPLLMMPSILSLAFPGENPSLNRSAGALVPVFVIAGIGFYVFIIALSKYFAPRPSRMISLIIGMIVISISILNNYKIVFKEYKEQFDKNAWNSSEIGGVIKNFIRSGNNPDHAFVIPYPHWVDTRLVGFNAGYPGKDYALWHEEILDTETIQGEKLFIFKPEDGKALFGLETHFPGGEARIFHSRIPTREFIIYTVNGSNLFEH